MSWETVACCDDCWWGTPNADGTITPNDRGILEETIRHPVRFRQEARTLDACHFCGWPSYSGIYVRAETTDQPAASLRVRKEEL